MSKFKVGDKVYRLEDRKEANKLWEVSSVQVMKKGDKEYYNYVLKAIGKVALLNFEEDLELYKTAHEKLLDLGFTFERKEHFIQYTHEKKDMRILVNTIMKKYGVFSSTNFDHKYRFVDLELSKILTEYLEELENEK